MLASRYPGRLASANCHKMTDNVGFDKGLLGSFAGNGSI